MMRRTRRGVAGRARREGGLPSARRRLAPSCRSRRRRRWCRADLAARLVPRHVAEPAGNFDHGRGGVQLGEHRPIVPRSRGVERVEHAAERIDARSRTVHGRRSTGRKRPAYPLRLTCPLLRRRARGLYSRESSSIRVPMDRVEQRAFWSGRRHSSVQVAEEPVRHVFGLEGRGEQGKSTGPFAGSSWPSPQCRIDSPVLHEGDFAAPAHLCEPLFIGDVLVVPERCSVRPGHNAGLRWREQSWDLYPAEAAIHEEVRQPCGMRHGACPRSRSWGRRTGDECRRLRLRLSIAQAGR